MSEQLCVLVTGVGGRAVGHQVLHALSLLGDKYRVVACDMDRYSYGLYQSPHRYRLPGAKDPDYLDALEAVIRREKVDVVIPGTEIEVAVLGPVLDRFRALGVTMLVNPAPVVALCSNKGQLYTWLEANGIGVPRTAAAGQWRQLAEECGYPLVVKPTEGTGASRGVALLCSEDEVEQYLALLPAGKEVVFQQYVEGDDSEYTVGVMVSRDGRIIDSIVMHRKLIGLSLGMERVFEGKRYALSTGYSQGFIIKHPFIQAKCEELVLRIGARGPMNIQCRLSGETLYVFEVHPRFSGTSSFRADVGFNEPDVLIRNFRGGEEFGRIPYQYDVAALRAFSNIIVPLSEYHAVEEIHGED